MSEYNPFPSKDSIETFLIRHFTSTKETNIHVDPRMRYKFGYGADLEKVYLTDKVKIIGIMFCHPGSAIASKDILPRLEYLHYRSGEYTDLFWAGYGPFMHGRTPPPAFPVKIVGDTEWAFSDEAFNAMRVEIEANTTWKYSGETDLLLTTARLNPETHKAYLDFSETLVCDLDKMLQQGAITSVARFLEELFRFGENSSTKDVFDYSDFKFLDSSKRTLWRWLLDRLKVRGYFERTEPFAIRDISK